MNFEAIVKDHQPRLVSFDVFDTVVTRKVADPTAVFLVVGQDLFNRGIIEVSPEVFARRRREAEIRVRKNSRAKEVSLRDIYEELAFGGRAENAVDLLVAAELSAESEAICAVPRVCEILKRIRKQIGRIVFISDMYLPSGFIEDRLAALDLFHSGDKLYVSSEYGEQKRDGGLFRIVLDREGIVPEELLHFGDSADFDIVPARKIGIATRRVTWAIPNVSEKLLADHAPQNGNATAWMAGASRITRLRAPELKPDERVIWETAAGVTGPFVLLYSLWVLQRAKQKGIRTLYFLARDAYLPFLAVRILLEAEGNRDIEVRYLYGSRLTYLPLGIEAFGREEWDSLTTYGDWHCPTVEAIRSVLLCERDVFATHLESIGFPFQEWNRPLSADEFQRIREHALNDAAFNTAITESLSEFRKLTLRYLEREAFDPERGTALVDSGWTTRSHAPLYRFLKQAGCRNLSVFYIGNLMKKSEVPGEDLETFLFDRAKMRGVWRPGMEYARCLEILLMSDHGRTRTFQGQNGAVHPILEGLENPKFVERYFEIYKEALLSFIKEVVPSVQLTNSFHENRNVAEALVFRFWSRPTPAEARVWSRLVWEWDPLGKVRYPLARAYNLSDTWRAFLAGKVPDCGPQFWRGGARQLTPRWNRLLMNRAIAVRRQIGRCIKLSRLKPRIKQG